MRLPVFLEIYGEDAYFDSIDYETGSLFVREEKIAPFLFIKSLKAVTQSNVWLLFILVPMIVCYFIFRITK